jgi:hypothetical protein
MSLREHLMQLICTALLGLMIDALSDAVGQAMTPPVLILGPES